MLFLLTVKCRKTELQLLLRNLINFGNNFSDHQQENMTCNAKHLLVLEIMLTTLTLT